MIGGFLSVIRHSQTPFQLFTSKSLSPNTSVVRLTPGLRKHKTVSSTENDRKETKLGVRSLN